MSKKINGIEHDLVKIFSSDFDYIIPPYQRPYAWTTNEASELFDDLYDFYIETNGKDTYFLGSIVLVKKEKDPRSEVIDGQQRLTTLTILLAVIASKMPAENLKQDFFRYIQEPGSPSQGLHEKPRLALREKDRNFFKKYVQSLKFDELLKLETKGLANESQINIQSNSRLFLNKIDDIFGENMDLLFKFGSFIVQETFLVVVSTPDWQSAFRVFSVLNNRGLDLYPSDIIKADIIGKISRDKQDEVTKRWEEIETQAGREDFNDLFSLIRMIYVKKKAKHAIIKEFNDHVFKRDDDAEQFFEEILTPYADSYIIAKRQDYKAQEKAEDINKLLRWLNRIDNSDWLPPAMQFLFQKKDEPEYVLYFFSKLERLAAYLHVCAKNINSRIERYAKVISSLEDEEHSINNPVKSMELTSDEKKEMKDALNGNVYELTARRRNYIILRLDSFLSDQAAIYDPSILTIEHVLPQNIKKGSEWEKNWPDDDKREAWKHRIANLVPLTQRRNTQASNYDFQRKKDAYFSGKEGVSSYALTSQVLKEDAWTLDIVKNRQKDLLSIFAKNWEL